MFARILGLVTGITIGILQAQTIDLKGRVMAGGVPAADAMVILKAKKDTLKTGADGTFALTGNVSLGQGAGRSFQYRVVPGFLSLDLRAPLELQVEAVDGAGHLQGRFDRRLEAGHHGIALADAMPAFAGKTGLYFLRLRLGGETFTHPYYHSGSNPIGSDLAPAYRVAAAKQAAVVDTLLIRKSGYQDLVQEITSYTAGNLGDLTLTATAADGWVNLYNGKDLSNWIPLIHGFKVGNNVDSTFRPDVVNNMISVRYDKYPNLNFADRCGNLYYNKLLTNYRIRVTYRFVEPQAKMPVSWGKYNSGLMIFAIDPAKVTGDPEFPPLIEIQILGQGSPGGNTNPTTNLNYCFPNGITMTTHSADCGNNHTGKAANPPDQWTTIEADVSVTGVTKVYQFPDTTNPVETMSGPMYNNKPVTNGYVTLQSESQPIDFKDILLKELP